MPRRSASCLVWNRSCFHCGLLEAGMYLPVSYHTFTIYEPKKRPIAAAPFRDRVAHHAVCAVYKLTFMPHRQYDYASRKIDEVGRMMGAWVSIEDEG